MLHHAANGTASQLKTVMEQGPSSPSPTPWCCRPAWARYSSSSSSTTSTTWPLAWSSALSWSTLPHGLWCLEVHDGCGTPGSCWATDIQSPEAASSLGPTSLPDSLQTPRARQAPTGLHPRMSHMWPAIPGGTGLIRALVVPPGSQGGEAQRQDWRAPEKGFGHSQTRCRFQDGPPGIHGWPGSQDISRGTRDKQKFLYNHGYI